nr:MAG TPA: hypothetical protein [Caudoviricetes sp.]
MREYKALAIIAIAAIIFYAVCYFALYWYIDKFIYES